jgi:hypothetical protein
MWAICAHALLPRMRRLAPIACVCDFARAERARPRPSAVLRGLWRGERRAALWRLGCPPSGLAAPPARYFAGGRSVVVDGGADDARFVFVDVVLRKLGKGARAVAGRLVRAPRKGSVVVIEFPDGMHEYVTTPVKRVLRIAGREIFYIETINSRYRLEVRGRETAAVEGTG